MSGMWLKVRRVISSTVNTGFDLTYLAGFRKKLDVLAKVKQCDIVGKWSQSIINHLYWCVVSTPPDDCEKIKAKWQSKIIFIMYTQVTVQSSLSVHMENW